MLGIMQCVAEAVVAKGVSGLLEFVPGGQYLFDVAADAIRRHRARKAQARLEDEVKELVVARADAAIQAANQAAEEAGPQLSPRDRALLKQFLASIPDAARQSLRRKEDPSGRSVPAGFHLQMADDLVKLLPKHPPRFAPGDPLPGLASWRLRERLGSGGFGEVWLARHEWRSDLRAVKFCSDPKSGRRLAEHEKNLIVRVMEHAGDHPNIVPLLECNVEGDTPWLMYEYVRGGTLTDLVWEWQTLPSAERFNQIVEALHTLAGAVGHFHRLDPAIVHRDLKPANVLRDAKSGALRITDFGIGGVAAAVQIAEQTRGTCRIPTGVIGAYSDLYASPEQRKGEKPNPWDDVHALGVIAYQLLTGDLTAAPGTDVIDELCPLGVPEGLITLISKSVAQKADRRPKDASEWESALKQWRKPPVRRIQVKIPGEWFSRPVHQPFAEWTYVTETPAEITLYEAEDYFLNVAKGAQDSDLAGLAEISNVTAFQHISLRRDKQLTNAALVRFLEFRPADGRFTSGLAVTYPPTISDREFENIGQAINSGLRRARSESRDHFDKYNINRLYPFVIDEASAAMMFYLCRDIHRDPGSCRTIKYLYPTGMNVLIYDCGGRSTDIALVHVYSVYDQPSDRVSELHVNVIGRSWHRSFGGNDITSAVFAILKARIATILTANMRPKPLQPPDDSSRLARWIKDNSDTIGRIFPIPPDPSRLPRWIKDNSDTIEKIFPTRFNRANIGQQHTCDLFEVVWYMWKMAERIKIQLEKATTAWPMFAIAHNPLVIYITGLAKNKDQKLVANQLSAISVSRDEVDAVIQDGVHATIDRANDLIRRRLRPDAPAGAEPGSVGAKPAALTSEEISNAPGLDALPATIRARGGEVHAVYVVGNASRYPLIRKSLESMLDVPFLQPDGDLPGRLVFEPENLIEAVAKGAIAALQLQNEHFGVEVRYDSDPIHRLPFDILLSDLVRGDQLLYREGQLYEDLTKPREIFAPPPRPENQFAPEAGREVTFKRQWPGERFPTPYLTFRFPAEVVGPLRVEYFGATEESPSYFQMTDLGGSGASVIGEEEVEALYISPPQSGEL